MKGLGDLGNIMKLQREMKSMQKKIKKMKMNGESSGGEVKALVNGEYRLLELNISDEILKEGNGKTVSKLVLSAVNNAIDKLKDQSKEEMMKLTGGMDLPDF